LFGDLQFETNLISIHVTLGVGSGVQLLGVTSPWGLVRGIHAADTPAQPIYPATDRFLQLPPTQREKRRAKSNSGSLRSEPSVGSALQEAWATGHAAFAFDLFFFLRGWTLQEPVSGRAGG
ncbi:hypothetical protein, partial [Stenotrophomonas sp. 2694]|uniref:hypothetical protein n=1 Tax=Stenotrophomonas sp. 2694 TaxID=3156317 RepID=UPI003392DE79